MDSGQVAAVVSLIGIILAFFNVSGVTSSDVAQVVNGVIAAVSIISGIYSAYSHSTKTATLAAAGLR